MKEKPSSSFANDRLFSSGEANIFHFNPTDNGRDRFGNRLFSSPTLAYFDREKQTTKSSLLLSKDGEEFIKNHSHVLQDISDVLGSINTKTPGGDLINRTYRLKNGGEVSYMSTGGQSDVYKLEIDGVKYIIKRFRDNFPEGGFNSTQPYINEMLQTQSVTVDLKEQLEKFGIQMQAFLIASGQFSLVKFEEGEEPSQGDFRKFTKLEELLTGYIAGQKAKGILLWRNIKIDYKNWFDSTINTKNFVKKRDGNLIWVDPFYYSENTERASAIFLNEGKVLLIHRIFSENDYWGFPGETIREDEPVESAIKRWLPEDSNVEIVSTGEAFRDVDKKVNSLNHFVVCEFKTDGQSEPQIPVVQKKDYKDDPVWVNIDEVNRLPLVPVSAKNKLIDYLRMKNLL